MSVCRYKSGYKFQLADDMTIETGIKGHTVVTDYLILTIHGLLCIKKGYAWDGATAFPDFRWIIRGSAIHDAGFQLVRLGHLDRRHIVTFNRLLEKCCKEDRAPWGMPAIVYQGVKRFGNGATLPSAERQVQVAP